MRERNERLLRNTTLPEFLNACHEDLFCGLDLQQDKDSSTKDDPANAGKQVRPKRIEKWRDFPEEQIRVWRDIMDSEFVTERHFTSLPILKGFVTEV